MSENDKSWMNVEEAARYIGVSGYTLRIWVNDGIIPAKRPGGKILFFKREEIDAAIAARSATAEKSGGAE